jgi:hypothetical protein
MSNQSLTEKIAKLLNQAENAGTEAEASVFMQKAQEMATLYSIDLAKARHITVAKEKTTPVQRTITLGVRGTRGLNTLVELFRGIASANDVTMNIAHNSTYVIAFGFAEDIDVAETLFASLSVQMAAAAAEYRKDGSWKTETVYRPGRYRKPTKAEIAEGHAYWRSIWEEGDYVPMSWLSARLDFQEGFARRVGVRLFDAKMAAERAAKTADMTAAAEAAAAIDEGSTGTALVLVEKREAISAFYKKHSNARGSYKGGRQVSSSQALGAGRAAGDRARLSNSTGIGGARKAIA